MQFKKAKKMALYAFKVIYVSREAFPEYYLKIAYT
jgi:hypothetical protein